MQNHHKSVKIENATMVSPLKVLNDNMFKNSVAGSNLGNEEADTDAEENYIVNKA